MSYTNSPLLSTWPLPLQTPSSSFTIPHAPSLSTYPSAAWIRKGVYG